MLLRFSVSNHLSIRDPQELLFTASSLKDRSEGLIDCPAAPNRSLLPAAVIYGANASGKSNFLDALSTMRTMVLRSHTHGAPDGGLPRRVFALDQASSDQSLRFEIDFVNDGVRYHYGFEASDAAFESEWLYEFPRSHRRTLFERDGKEFRFGRGLAGPNKTIAGLTRSNSLYVSAAAQNGHKQLSEVLAYFRSIRGARDIDVPGTAASTQLAEAGPDRRVIDFLGKIGTGVVACRRKEVELAAKTLALRRDLHAAVGRFANIPSDLRPDPEDKEVTIELAHRGQDGGSIYFDLNWESAGTRRLLVVLELAFRALDDGVALYIDELDASLHTQACEAVLKLFCSSETNPKGAQLIATTHDTNLLNSPSLRRDQLWFTEKDDAGATQLYPLTDIRTRRGDNFERGYLQGRYGAVPFDDPVSALGTPR